MRTVKVSDEAYRFLKSNAENCNCSIASIIDGLLMKKEKRDFLNLVALLKQLKYDITVLKMTIPILEELNDLIINMINEA